MGAKTQPPITCSKLTIETLEQGVKYAGWGVELFRIVVILNDLALIWYELSIIGF